MKRLRFLLYVLLFSTLVHSQPVSDPNVQEREAKNFHAISINGPFDVYLTQSNEEKIAVSASDEKLLENIKTEIKDGVLQIDWVHTQKLNLGKKKLRAYISFKNIDKLKASDNCDLKIFGETKLENLDVDLSGASDLITGKLNAKQLSFMISGASDVQVSGSAEKLDIDARGASSFKGFNFSTDYCNIKANNASDISITVNKELSAHASGASEIGYKGEAVVRELKITGSCSVSHKS
jgi:anti-sigma28 factor (negative regulator of flagellin synthesis)